MFPPEPDLAWRVAILVTMIVAVVAIVAAALALAYDFVRDWRDEVRPDRLPVDRLRNVLRSKAR